MEALEVGYSKHKNPYHNLMHAADVTQTVHYLLFKTGVAVSKCIAFLRAPKQCCSVWVDLTGNPTLNSLIFVMCESGFEMICYDKFPG